MKKVNDRSYGIIPVRLVNQDWEFLIVRHLGGHWAFPKGHPEANESPKQAAIRELKEETGMQLKRFFRRYPFSEQYVFYHAGQRISKTVMYYLAEVEGHLERQVEELIDAKWESFENCCEKLTYPRSVQICQQCYAFLTAPSDKKNIKPEQGQGKRSRRPPRSQVKNQARKKNQRMNKSILSHKLPIAQEGSTREST
jgi:bis(5'-nucleosidyl)-tetraphosphatase